MLAKLPDIDISLLQFEIKVLKTLRGFLCKNSMCICWLLSVCRLVLRNVNKTDISIPEQTVYYISQYRLLHQNYHCKNNETKQIHVLQQLEISKAIDGDSAMFISSIWENHHVPLPR